AAPRTDPATIAARTTSNLSATSHRHVRPLLMPRTVASWMSSAWPRRSIPTTAADARHATMPIATSTTRVVARESPPAANAETHIAPATGTVLAAHRHTDATGAARTALAVRFTTPGPARSRHRRGDTPD